MQWLRTVSKGDWGFMGNTWMCLFVCVVWGELVVIQQRILYLSCFMECRLGKGDKILDFSCSTFCRFLIFFCQNLTNDFFDKSSAVFQRCENYTYVVIFRGDRLLARLKIGWKIGCPFLELSFAMRNMRGRRKKGR